MPRAPHKPADKTTARSPDGKRATTLSVYGYTDYRAYLRNFYDMRKESERGYSYRAFSKAAGFSSPNTQGPSTSPTSGQGPKDSVGASSAPDSSAPTTASNAAGEGKDSTNTTMASSSTGGATTATATSGATTLPPDILGAVDVAFASCASPLAKDFTGTTTYSVSIGSGVATKVVVQKDADAKSWDIVDTNAKLLRKILVNATNTSNTFGVTATDGSGNAIGLSYQCAAVATTTNVTLAGQTNPVTKRTLTLTETTSGRTKQLVWYITPATSTTAIAVPRVELTDQATGVLTVFAAQ